MAGRRRAGLWVAAAVVLALAVLAVAACLHAVGSRPAGWKVGWPLHSAAPPVAPNPEPLPSPLPKPRG